MHRRRAFEIAQRVDTGTMWINCHMNINFDVPIGAAKHSGLGCKLGQEGFEEFTNSRSSRRYARGNAVRTVILVNSVLWVTVIWLMLAKP